MNYKTIFSCSPQKIKKKLKSNYLNNNYVDFVKYVQITNRLTRGLYLNAQP